jgi:hypothetical protein
MMQNVRHRQGKHVPSIDSEQAPTGRAVVLPYGQEKKIGYEVASNSARSRKR